MPGSSVCMLNTVAVFPILNGGDLSLGEDAGCFGVYQPLRRQSGDFDSDVSQLG